MKNVYFGVSKEDFIAAYNALEDGVRVMGEFSPTANYCVVGYKAGALYGAFIVIGYQFDASLDNIMRPLVNIYNGVWTWNSTII